MNMPDAFEESDLRAAFKAGGKVLGAFIVARSENTFAVYVRGDWGRKRGFRILRTWRGASGDRTFKNLHSALRFVRQLGWAGRMTIYPISDPELAAFVGVQEQDMAIGRTAVSDEGIAPDT